MTDEQQQQVVAEAESWIGTPFRHAARVKGEGVDCAQLLIGVFANAGLIAGFDPDPYPPDWYLHHSDERYLSYIRQRCDPVLQGDPWQPGDVLTYSRGWRSIGHAGIYIGGDRIVHALEAAGRVVSDDINSRFLRRWFAGAWRLRNGAA